MEEMTTIEMPKLEAAFLRVFLTGAVEQMKEQCSLKEVEDPEILMAFTVLNKFIAQLPEAA